MNDDKGIAVAEIAARAKQLWGEKAIVKPWLRSDGDRWCIALPREASLHYLSKNGRVACGHSSCLLRQVEVDAKEAR